MKTTRVTVVTVVYGTRWHFLKQVADSMLSDDKVKTFVIVDNGAADTEEMDQYAKAADGRIVILRQSRNIGYSGAIAKGLDYARETDCNFVFVLDDDSVPEKGAIDHFLTNLRLFNGRKVVLVGNRIDMPGNKEIFTRRPLQDIPPRGTLFEVFSFRKLGYFFRLVFGLRSSSVSYPFLPIVPTEAFVTGGTFLPIDVVREADLPDAGMFIYGEDLEYAWRIRKLGYQPYACARPIIRDIDLTFPEYGGHIFGLFEPATPVYKVYYRMRNAVIISLRHSDQSRFVLSLNVFVWYLGLCLIGLYKQGPTKIYFKRLRLIAKALYTGFVPKTRVPDEVVTPA